MGYSGPTKVAHRSRQPLIVQNACDKATAFRRPPFNIVCFTAIVNICRSTQIFPRPQTLCALAIVLSIVGCNTTQPRTFTVERPVRHTTEGDGFVIQTNFPLGRDAPLVQELNQLKVQIQQRLELPTQRDSVTVYLFSDEPSYRRYMKTTWPNLPPRRAYFVGTSRELAVYSFHGAKVEEDLRHEFTHGLLHASLNSVPLWLDEGLAEYFEVRGSEIGGPHQEHIRQLQKARSEGWNPSLYQLEQLADFQKMTQRDYAEAWGWVHFMLHTDDQARRALVAYLHDLESKTIPAPFMPQLEKANPAYYNGMISHVSGMAQGIALVSHQR